MSMTIDLVAPPSARDHDPIRRARPIARSRAPYGRPGIDVADAGSPPAESGPIHEPASSAPRVDEYDLLWRGETWCALSPIEAAIVRTLIEHGQRVVTRREIGARAWPNGMPAGRPVDGRLHRLRARLAPLGLRIHSIRRRGLLLAVDPVVPAGGTRQRATAPWTADQKSRQTAGGCGDSHIWLVSSTPTMPSAGSFAHDDPRPPSQP
jgi:DNA-binding winged helix-turn-helix (wHTH) protein